MKQFRDELTNETFITRANLIERISELHEILRVHNGERERERGERDERGRGERGRERESPFQVAEVV